MGFSRQNPLAFNWRRSGWAQEAVGNGRIRGVRYRHQVSEVYSNVPSHVIPAMRAASGYRLANNDA